MACVFEFARRVRGILANRGRGASKAQPDSGVRSILLFKGIFCLTGAAPTGNVTRFRLALSEPRGLTGAEIVVRCLQEEGVEYVFG